MVVITPKIRIPESELSWSFTRSGGPGGQNVNKVASKAELRWPVAVSPSLPEPVKIRLLAQQHNRISATGELILTSQRFRDQGRNREECLEKLRALVLAAIRLPKPRKATRPTRGAKEARLKAKKHRAVVKKVRRTLPEE